MPGEEGVQVSFERVDLSERVTIYRGDCIEVLKTLGPGSVDVVVTDPPYSERTHAGHDAGAKSFERRGISYLSWKKEDVEGCVSQLTRLCRGWIVVMTDHNLYPYWAQGMKKEKRYVFAPLPWYVRGSRVRLMGDGPSTWTVWIIVSRTEEQVKWGTLPGGYTEQGKQEIVGGKPVELMQSLIRDYSKKEDIVLDPCMGSGTTGVACIRTDRKFIGIEIDPEYFEMAKARLQEEIRLRGMWEKSDDPVPERKSVALKKKLDWVLDKEDSVNSD